MGAKWIAYLRVSTKQQEHSGLGLDAQRAIIEYYAKTDKAEIVNVFVEQGSAKNITERPILQEAIRICQREGYTLVVAKLDRLSRDGQDGYGLLKDLPGQLKSCDIPVLDSLTLGIFIALAMREREMTSIRTKLALGELKKQGKKLGKPENLTIAHRHKGIKAAAEKTNDFRTDRKLTSFVESCVKDGMSREEIAELLNKNGFKTYRGKEFNQMSVWRMIDSLKDTNVAANSLAPTPCKSQVEIFTL